ncbi:hypothetical protein DFH09DRAFT_1288197 [Mycena vulgaris]|nr:hypothetical protein DFH09DRAFT_1288197 [Mycena vulgaris]
MWRRQLAGMRAGVDGETTLGFGGSPAPEAGTAPLAHEYLCIPGNNTSRLHAGRSPFPFPLVTVPHHQRRAAVLHLQQVAVIVRVGAVSWIYAPKERGATSPSGMKASLPIQSSPASVPSPLVRGERGYGNARGRCVCVSLRGAPTAKRAAREWEDMKAVPIRLSVGSGSSDMNICSIQEQYALAELAEGCTERVERIATRAATSASVPRLCHASVRQALAGVGAEASLGYGGKGHSSDDWGWAGHNGPKAKPAKREEEKEETSHITWRQPLLDIGNVTACAAGLMFSRHAIRVLTRHVGATRTNGRVVRALGATWHSGREAVVYIPPQKHVPERQFDGGSAASLHLRHRGTRRPQIVPSREHVHGVEAGWYGGYPELGQAQRRVGVANGMLELRRGGGYEDGRARTDGGVASSEHGGKRKGWSGWLASAF